MKWVEEAEKAVGRVPFFVRKRVRKRVEEEAARQGASVVLLSHVHDCQRRYLENMDKEVQGYQVETCFGPNGCPNRAVGVEGLAESLENLLRRKHLREFMVQKVKGPLKLHHDFRVSVSDCPNGCSRPQIADIGILGACRPRATDSPCTQCEACRDGCREEAITLDPDRGPVLDEDQCVLCGHCIRTCPSGALGEAEQGYRIQLGGKLGRHPQLARELDGIYTAEETLHIVERCIDFYMEHCLSGERFGEVMNRIALKL